MQKPSAFFSWRPLAALLPLSILGLLVAYTYAYLYKAPQCGFFYDPNNGEIISFYGSANSAGALQEGDVLQKIGAVTWNQHLENPTSVLFDHVTSGQTVEITVQRSDSSLTIPWVFLGFTQEEFTNRLLNNWWLGYFFWLFGTLTLLFMRPKDGRWRLLIAANYLLAFWLVLGNLSGWQVWGSSLLLHAVTWLMLPVFLNFHWIFPKPLGKISRFAWGALFGFSAILALGQLIDFLPGSLYLLGFLLLLIGSITLLIVHYAKQSDQRREIGLLAVALLVAVLPSILLAISGIFGGIPHIAALALLALPIMPGAYVYATFRRSLGGMELRANRIIGLILYGVLVLSVSMPVTFAISSINDKGISITVGLSFTLVLCLATGIAYPSFQRWVERRLLRMPMPPASVLETYMARITTSMEREALGDVLCDEVFPSLLVRQAALLRLEDEQQFSQVCLLGVSADQLPGPDDVPGLLAESGKVRPPVPGETLACPWVHLVLSLKLDSKPIGLCLLGRRDPDDYYSVTEIPTLQALMDQSALAIINIEQSEHLHALYMADIERQEVERSRLALELHDDVLGQMALLAMNSGESNIEPQFDQAYKSATEHIRQIISGLHPTMLNYGLWSALDEMVDAMETSDSGTSILMEIPTENNRYPQAAELHLFRIAQQACQNALQHAQAKAIRITGSLQPDSVDLIVEDNGVGFNVGEQLDLPGLLAGKHFGLAGMYERAALIGAKVRIESEPGISTRVRVTWHPEK